MCSTDNRQEHSQELSETICCMYSIPSISSYKTSLLDPRIHKSSYSTMHLISNLLCKLLVLAFFGASVKSWGLPEPSGVLYPSRQTSPAGSAIAVRSSSACSLFVRTVEDCATDNDEQQDQSPESLSKIMQRPSETKMTSAILPVLAAAILITTMPLSAMAEGDIARGATLFNNNCASCHRGGENIMKPAKTLQEKDLLKNLGSADQATIGKFFTSSLNHKLLNFPNVPGGKLSETDVVDVTSYVSDQATGSKW